MKGLINDQNNLLKQVSHEKSINKTPVRHAFGHLSIVGVKGALKNSSILHILTLFLYINAFCSYGFTGNVVENIYHFIKAA